MEPDGPQLIEPISDEQLLAIVRSAFGAHASMDFRARTEGGQFNTAYRIRTTNPSAEFILRVAPSSCKPLFRYERRMMMAEPRIYDLIRNAGVPMPAVLACDGSGSAIDREFNCIEYVDAVPLNHTSVPEDAKPGLMREVGIYTARIHSIASDQFGWPLADGSIAGGTSWAEVFGDLLGETCSACESAHVLTDEEASDVMGTFARNQDAFDACTEPRLIHNDIWAPNVLVRKSEEAWEVAAIIDADRAMFADREMEFIVWEADPHFLEGYGMPLDESPEAVMRRAFYSLYLYLFCAWAYKIQIWRPDEQASIQTHALGCLREVVRTYG